jgi:hypothetical protein
MKRTIELTDEQLAQLLIALNSVAKTARDLRDEIEYQWDNERLVEVQERVEKNATWEADTTMSIYK